MQGICTTTIFLTNKLAHTHPPVGKNQAFDPVRRTALLVFFKGHLIKGGQLRMVS